MHGCLGPPRNRRCAHRPWNSLTRHEQEIRTGRSHIRCGVWGLPEMVAGQDLRREERQWPVGVQGEQEGPPESLVKKAEVLMRRGEGDKMGSSDAPQTSLSCVSCRTPGRAGFTPSLGVKGSPRDAGDPLPTEERESSHVPPLRPPYIDAAQVEPLL